MKIGEFFKNAIYANKAVDHAAIQHTIDAIGEGGVTGRLGTLKTYSTASKNYYEAMKNGGDISEEYSMLNKLTGNMHKHGDSIKGSVNNILDRGGDTSKKVNEAISNNMYDEATKSTNKVIKDYKDNIATDPKELKESIERLHKTNTLNGKGSLNTAWDAATSYLTGADIRAGVKLGSEKGGYSVGEGLGIGATRAATVLGGTALTVGGVSMVGRGIFGSGGGGGSSNGYSY